MHQTRENMDSHENTDSFFFLYNSIEFTSIWHLIRLTTGHFFSANKDVDVELRIVCEQFIQSVSESLIAPLSAFLAKVRIIKQLNEV